MSTNNGNTPIIDEPTGSRLVISMAIAGFISGIIIISIYLLTFDTIKENKARELENAVFNVLPGAVKMHKLHYQSQHQSFEVVHTDEVDDEMVFSAYDKNDQFIGYAIQGAGPGFQDTIKLLFGYSKQSSEIVGMQILDSRETPGLGDKIFKDMDFVNEFNHLFIDKEIKLVKKGKKTANNQVDAITGATISSKAVVKIINHAFLQWQDKILQQKIDIPWQENSLNESQLDNY